MDNLLLMGITAFAFFSLYNMDTTKEESKENKLINFSNTSSPASLSLHLTDNLSTIQKSTSEDINKLSLESDLINLFNSTSAPSEQL
jgi:hypothetical protein